MNILQVIPYMHPNGGGPPVVVDRFSRHLSRQGHIVQVLTTDALAPSDDATWVDNYGSEYELNVLPAWRRNPFGYNRLLERRLNAFAAHADIVHVHNLWSYSNQVTANACRRLKVPFVVSTHGMLDPNSLSRKAWKKSLYGRFLEFPRLKRASGIIFTHSEEERLARQSCPGLPKGFVVPLGSDDPPKENIAQAAEKLLIQNPDWAGRKLVLFFGRIHPKKGLDLLIPAFARLRQKHEDVHLVLAGPVDLQYRRELEILIEKHGIEECISWLGPVHGTTKWGLFSLVDLFTLPSYQENFAITVVESMRMGVPVVLSDHVNIWQEIVDCGAGLRCELTFESVAETLECALTSQEFLDSARKAGPAIVEERYTWQAATQSLIRAYNEIVERTTT